MIPNSPNPLSSHYPPSTQSIEDFFNKKTNQLPFNPPLYPQSTLPLPFPPSFPSQTTPNQSNQIINYPPISSKEQEGLEPEGFDLIQQVDKLNFNEEEEPENHQNQLQKTPEKDEYVYFMKEPKKKLILNYEICSYLMFKEGFKDCLCNLDISPSPSRNILITNINQQTFNHFLASIKTFGDIQNLDLCNFEKEGTLVISYYNWLDSLEAYQKLRTIYSQELAQNILRIEFLLPYNQNNFLDFILVSNRTSFPTEFLKDFFSRFGQISCIIPRGDIYIVKFYDIRSIDKVKTYILKAKTSPENFTADQSLIYKDVHFFDNDSQNNLFFKYFETLVPGFNPFQALKKINLKLKKPKASLQLSSQAFTFDPATKPDTSKLENIDDLLNDTQINLDRIANNKDQRTTLMIRNIPNRYTQANMINFVNINFKGLYDFIYMPTDNMNKCNIGYCFINFIQPKHIIKFFQEFNGKRWELFRSEKVCVLNYARIQGKLELIKHFKNFNNKNHQNEPLILFNPILDAPFSRELGSNFICL